LGFYRETGKRLIVMRNRELWIDMDEDITGEVQPPQDGLSSYDPYGSKRGS
jgi:hypothetical protein